MGEQRWPLNGPYQRHDWIEFTMPAGKDQKDSAGQPDDSPRLVRVNASFMLSKWKCIFGQGCPGVLISGAMFDRGCCQIGVTVSLEEYGRLQKYVDQLTDEDLDADLLQKVKEKGWSFKVMEGDQNVLAPTRNGRRKIRKVLDSYHTKVVDGACILANRASGSLSAPGCSLHRLAIRKGLHHSDTKPDICWAIPLRTEQDYDEDSGMLVITVTGTSAHIWGSYDRASVFHPGWWCVESPDAYVAEESVYRSSEVELRKLLGDDVYQMMKTELEWYAARTIRVSPMLNSTTIGSARTLIPLAVRDRVEVWRKEGAKEELNRSTEVINRLGIE